MAISLNNTQFDIVCFMVDEAVNNYLKMKRSGYFRRMLSLEDLCGGNPCGSVCEREPFVQPNSFHEHVYKLVSCYTDLFARNELSRVLNSS